MPDIIQLGFIREAPPMGDPTNSIVIDHNINYNETGSVNYDTIVARGSLGAIYTYNSSRERTLNVEIEVVDYTGDGSKIQTTKRLLRKWREAQISGGNIVAPPPVLEFQYVGLTDDPIEIPSLDNNRGTFFNFDSSPIKCVMLDYSINVDSSVGWNMDRAQMNDVNSKIGGGGSGATFDGTPKILKITLNLADIQSHKFRNMVY